MEQLLLNLDCLTENNKFTNAGVLFFAKSTEFIMLQATVTCVLYQGNKKLHILDRKDYKGNMLSNIEDAVTFIFKHTNLAYKIEHIRREEIPEFPEVAIREAIVNAVCHRDYFVKNVIMIEVFNDRVEITSPVGLPNGLTDKTFGTRSVPRNLLLTDLLLRVGYIEKAGTGISRIKDEIKKHGLGKVKFSYDGYFFTVVFTREQEKNLRASLDEMSEKMSEKMSEMSEMSEIILELIKIDPKISARKIADKLNITSRTAERYIATIKNLGKLKRVGTARNGFWQIIEN